MVVTRPPATSLSIPRTTCSSRLTTQWRHSATGPTFGACAADRDSDGLGRHWLPGLGLAASIDASRLTRHPIALENLRAARKGGPNYFDATAKTPIPSTALLTVPESTRR